MPYFLFDFSSKFHFAFYNWVTPFSVPTVVFGRQVTGRPSKERPVGPSSAKITTVSSFSRTVGPCCGLWAVGWCLLLVAKLRTSKYLSKVDSITHQNMDEGEMFWHS